jgi:hypothetical protein
MGLPWLRESLRRLVAPKHAIARLAHHASDRRSRAADDPHMTWLVLLRALAYAGTGMSVDGRDLVIDAPIGLLTAAVTAGLRHSRTALLVSIAPAAIRREMSIPARDGISPRMAVVLLWLDAERRGFTPQELAACRARIAERVVAGDPEYCARVLAIEDVVRSRPNGDQWPATVGAQLAVGSAT